ncbi:MAG: threonine synthase [Bacteroidetes bacterium]|nr:threonine synthase [Bacteroidota bacterium]
MRYYSTKNKSTFYSLEQAVLKGLPDDNGLFMPERIEALPHSFWKDIGQYSFQEIAYEMCKQFLAAEVPEAVILKIVNEAINFDAPLVKLDAHTHVLELFHGPTLAFKDFGARFMAQLMRYFVRSQNEKITILVATSGDTGSAVASGFYKVDGIEVIILYPSGKVSDLQEKQLTTLGENIRALEIDGSFDDCQSLVKQAFLDKELTLKFKLSSANSINIARLIPQSFYYANAYKQLKDVAENLVFAVPSGNFGDLTAGLFARQMGMPVKDFIAVSNANDVVPAYLKSGIFTAKPSIQTLSNAMDVGNPSNFARMMDIFDNSIAGIQKIIKGYSVTDADTILAMKEIYSRFGYVMDPHGAVGYAGLKRYQLENPKAVGVILETAHPAKFLETVEQKLNFKLELPEGLKAVATKDKRSIVLSKSYVDFKNYLLGN